MLEMDLFSKVLLMGAGSMAQMVECLPCRHGALSLDTSIGKN
jgi:hypothetical protein